MFVEHNRERYVTHYVGENSGWEPTRKLCDQKGDRYWKKDQALKKLKKKRKRPGKRKVRELRR